MQRAGGAADDQEAQASAQPFEHLFADQAAEPRFDQELRDGVVLELVVDLGEELLGQQRHGDEDRGPQRLDVVADGAQALDEIHAAAFDQRHHEVGGEREGVEERQHDQKVVFGGDHVADGFKTALRVAAEVEVGEHRALGLAGGARGVDDRGDVLRRGLVGVIPGWLRRAHVGAQGFVIVAGAPSDRRERLAAAVGDDQRAHGRQFGQDGLQQVKVARVGENRDRLGILEDIRHLAGAQLGVERHDRDAGSGQGEVGLDPLRAVLKDQRHRFCAGFQIELAEGLGHLADACGQFCVGAFLPGGVAPVTQSHRVRRTRRRIVE